jgi:hypothetical protein
MSFSFAPNNEPLFVSEGDYVQFKFKAPPSWNTTQTVTIQVGDLLQYWLITTIPEDFTPDPFPLQGFEDAELDTLYTFGDGSRPGEVIPTITGLTPTTQAPVAISSNVPIPSGASFTDYVALRIDYDGNGTWDTGWIVADGTQTVENGARIQIRGRTSTFYTQFMNISLVIGTANETWKVRNEAIPGNNAVPFPDFTDLDPVEVDTLIYSEVLRVQGMNEDGPISLTNGGEYLLSLTSNTSTNADGYEVLSGSSWSTSGTVSNGDYLQLRILSPSTNSTPKSTDLSIADDANGSNWTVTTGVASDNTPSNFVFADQTGVLTNTLIGSDQQPTAGISGLTAGLSVPVEVVSTDSSLVRVQVNNGSIGVFPTSVQNGDKLFIYLQSASAFSTPKELQIRVGDRDISTWTVITGSGPDSDATFNVPPDLVNQIPGTYKNSAPVTVTGINIPITINATNGSLISIDGDTPVVGPRTFDPTVNTSFTLSSLVPSNLNTSQSTSVTVGTGSLNNPFTWTVSSYAAAPLPANNLGVWYSKKVEKFDGYPIGTVLPILKDNLGNYGDLDGSLGDRYPGFISCDGRSLSTTQYFMLFDVIEYTYGGSGSSFNLPDYRNRRLCGTGQVDASRANSVGLPVSGSIFNVGGEGGYWYFDKVDVLGSDPLEQIQGTGTTGLVSEYFSLGTVKIAGLETVTDDVRFNIQGTVVGQIGPLEDVVVQVPEHDHAYITAIPEGDGGDPLIRWGNSTGRGMFGVSSGQYGNTEESVGKGSIDAQVQKWVQYLNNLAGGRFKTELEFYEGGGFDMEQWVRENLQTQRLESGGNNPSPNVPGGIDVTDGVDFSSESNDNVTEVDFMTWWFSPVSVLSGADLMDLNPINGNSVAAVVDTVTTRFTIESYLPVSGTTNNHSHFITLDPIQNIQSDFSGGNNSGAGTLTAPDGAGLGNGATSINLIFNQTEIFMDMTDGLFVWNKSFAKPFPSVTMEPQIQVPIINPFHKTKYIIKAY